MEQNRILQIQRGERDREREREAETWDALKMDGQKVK